MKASTKSTAEIVEILHDYKLDPECFDDAISLIKNNDKEGFFLTNYLPERYS